MERPDMERIKQGLFRLQVTNPIVKDFEAVFIYATQLEEALRDARTSALEEAALICDEMAAGARTVTGSQGDLRVALVTQLTADTLAESIRSKK